MSRKILPAVALSAATLLLLAGCSDDDDTEAQPQATATVEEPAEGRLLSADELEKALITVEDLPAGFTESDPGPDEDVERASDDQKCQALLDEFAAFEKQTKDAPSAKNLFINETTLSVVGVELESYEGDEATKGIAMMSEMYETCGTWIEGDSSGESQITASTLSFPTVGDETFASEVAYTNEAGDLEAKGHLVVTRVGKNVSFVYNFADDADVADTEKLARTSVEKLEKASIA